MKHFTIAIIDSGVECPERYRGASVRCDENSDEYIIGNDYYDSNGHGTIVKNIIEKNVSDAELFIMKIFNDEEEVDSQKLIFALDYLNDKIQPNIVHMSLGVSFCDNILDLQKACEKLINRGTIIVSAYSNDGSLSYPAAFPFVIGVESSSKVIKKTDYFYLENSPINIAAIGVAQRLKGKDNRYFDVIGSSFSAPYITAKVARIFANNKKGLCTEEILKKLKEDSMQVYTATPTSPIEMPFKINKAIVFPYNKEINTLLRFGKHIKFEVLGVYDVKFLENLGKKVIIDKAELRIEAYEKIKWESCFDTVIIGHLDELNSISHREYTDRIVEQCIRYHKNIYSFDELSSQQQECMRKANLKFFTPKIRRENLPKNYEGKLHQIGKPILCICGTTPKQGKFSLQMKLKELMESNIKIGMLATEPSGYLLGADVVFPVGYNSTVYLEDGEEYISAINYAIANIEKRNVDLILTGLQSQTIPMKLCNVNDMVLFNHYCLLGINPDAVILVVNVFDDITYIKRTISYLENIIICDVIAIVIFPIQRTLKWNTLGNLSMRYSNKELQLYKKKLGVQLKKAIYILDDEVDIKNLTLECYQYFSDGE